MIAAAIVAAAVAAVAYDGGGYGIDSRAAVAVAVWWAVLWGVVLGVLDPSRVPRPARMVAVGLLMFASWTALSILWTHDAEASWVEFCRVALYAGIFVLAALLTTRVGGVAIATGLAVGILAIAVIGLASRLFPGLLPDGQLAKFLPSASTRLVFPLNYWNGLAIFAALALPALVCTAVWSDKAVLRGLALVPFPVVAVVLFLTSSRGGVATAGAALVLFVILAPNRWRAASVVVLGTAAGSAAVVVVTRHSVVTDGPFTSAAAGPAGRQVAAAVIGIGALAGILYGLVSSRIPDDARVPRFASIGAVALILLIGGAAVVRSHPIARFDEFRAPSVVDERSVKEHLFSTSGNERWQLWASAIDELRSRPIIGRGAGSFEAWWAQHGSRAVFVVNAHSLYLETGGELGVVGLLLLVGTLAAGLVTGLRRLRRLNGLRRAWLAAVTASFCAYLLAAAEDWVWQLPAVTIPPLVFLALMTGAGELSPRSAGRRPRSAREALLLRLALVAISLVVIGSACVLGLQNRALTASRNAAASGRLQRAAVDAATARDLEPWAASPRTQLALIQERADDLEGAESSIREATARASDDWRVWLIRARIETKLGRIAVARKSLARARTLNPRSELFANG
jgi:hypothetical protein